MVRIGDQVTTENGSGEVVGMEWENNETRVLVRHADGSEEWIKEDKARKAAHGS